MANKRGVELCSTQLLLFTAAILFCSALESQNMLNSNVIEPSAAGRSARHETQHNLLPAKENCKNSDCGNDKLAGPEVSYNVSYRIRAQQCSEFDKKSYSGKNINWKPYLRGDHLDECKLYCIADGQKFYVRLKNSVRDGTPCGKDYSKVCFKGKCLRRPKGCQKLDGPCVLDKRTKILGVFNSTKLNLGYNLVATIPVGATNVTIKEVTRSSSYLALKDHQTGTYLLNGHRMISLSKTFRLASSRVTYSRTGNIRRVGEMITIDGPLEKSLDIMMTYQRDPSIIMYWYFVTEDEYQKIKQRTLQEDELLYFPKPRSNNKITNGKSSRMTEQTEHVRKRPFEGESISFIAGQKQQQYSKPSLGQVPYTGVGVDGKQAPYSPGTNRGFSYPQLSTDKQSQGGKQVSWYGSSWVQFGGDQNDQPQQRLETSAQVPERPFLNQKVFKPNPFVKRKQFVKPNQFHQPNQFVKTNQFGNPRLFQYQPGLQAANRFDDSKRTVYPRAQWGRTPNRFGDSVIPGNLGRTWQNGEKQFYTSNQEEDGFRWKIVGYTPCSSSCAGGMQSGIVKCTRASNGQNVADIKCDPTRRQEIRRVCNIKPCPASWVPQEWKACSKTCGEGEQVRDLMCKQVIDRSGEKVPVMLPVVKCPVELRPKVIRKCFVRECPKIAKPKWIVENWRECSVECGHGVQRRNIVCKDYKNDTVDNAECARVKKPAELKACYLGLCKADWYIRSDWSQCSRTCGSGIRSRPVVCARIGGSQLAEKYCAKKTKPENEQTCNAQHCKGIWVTSEWSKCSTDCGSGLQQRVVICMKSVNGIYQETFDADCSLDDKPAVRKDCSSNCVSSWFATPWTKCSATCGHGVQTRHVSCLSGEGKRVGGCKSWERPQQRRACYHKACPGATPVRSHSPRCKDNPPRSFKRYCHIIKRINYCRIPSYKKRCCATCAPKAGKTLGHI